jgi:hypothetical protein
MHLVLSLGLGILLKVILFISLYRLLSHYFIDKLYRFIVAYIIMYVAMIGLMLILSLFSGLRKEYLILSFLCISIITFCINRLYKSEIMPNKEYFNNIFHNAYIYSIIFVFIVFILLSIRSIYYFDTTYDGLAYELPRLSIFAQHQSLFVNYHTQTINIFSNEWIGELNSLYYLLISGSDQSTSFGNVEIWLFINLLFLWILSVFCNRKKYLGIIALLLSTLPVVLGLAMTVKTDLIAIGMLPFAVTNLFLYYQTQTNENLCISIIAIGMTAASKISLVPAAGLLLLGLLYYYIKYVKEKTIIPIIYGGTGFVIICSRYIINYIQYGNLFQRALNEKLTFSINNIINGINGILTAFTEISSIYRTIGVYSNNWVLNKKIGYAGPVLILIIIIYIYIIIININKRKLITFLKSEYTYILIIPLIVSATILLYSTIWYNWSFRYYAPWIICLIIGMISFAINNINYDNSNKWHKYFGRIVKTIVILTILINTAYCFRIGDELPTNLFIARSRSQIERKLAFTYDKYEEINKIPGLLELLNKPGNGLILNEFSTLIYQFMGRDHCFYTDLVYSSKELDYQLEKKDYSIIVIASYNYQQYNYKDIEKKIIAKGYKLYINSQGAIFIK